MPATADEQGRINCNGCGNTLWFLEQDEHGIRWLAWNVHVRSGQIRPIRFRADNQRIDVLTVDCERCGAKWQASPMTEPLFDPPEVLALLAHNARHHGAAA